MINLYIMANGLYLRFDDDIINGIQKFFINFWTDIRDNGWHYGKLHDNFNDYKIHG